MRRKMTDIVTITLRIPEYLRRDIEAEAEEKCISLNSEMFNELMQYHQEKTVGRAHAHIHRMITLAMAMALPEGKDLDKPNEKASRADLNRLYYAISAIIADAAGDIPRSYTREEFGKLEGGDEKRDGFTIADQILRRSGRPALIDWGTTPKTDATKAGAFPSLATLTLHDLEKAKS